MLVTEEEAKKRWCPMVRHSNGPDGTWNRYASNPQIPEHYKCIASECMAWRLAEREKIDMYGKTKGQNRGFCGLSGNPTAGG